MSAGDLEKAIHDALAPILAELVRIRELLERRTSAEAEPSSSLPEAPDLLDAPAALVAPATLAAPAVPAAPATLVAPPSRAAAAILAPQEATPPVPPVVTPPSAPAGPSPSPVAPPPEIPEADPVALLKALLADYPDDAAAVYFAFHRERRCAPEYLDRLAKLAGLENEWIAANRTTVGGLLERQHGGLAAVAELLGRDTDSLQALIDRIGMRTQVEAVRARARTRVENGTLAQRVSQLLFRDRLLQDLGIRAEQEALVRQELVDRCASLAGECDDACAVLTRLGQECALDASGLERLVRRFELQRFVNDLYQEPTEEQARPGLRRAARPEGNRRALDDEEIESRVLGMLLAKRKVGSAHTHIDHLVRTVPTHERGRARDIIERLVAEGMLVLKVTDNSAEPHISLSVAAVPLVEQRLHVADSTEGGSTCPT